MKIRYYIIVPITTVILSYIYYTTDIEENIYVVDVKLNKTVSII